MPSGGKGQTATLGVDNPWVVTTAVAQCDSLSTNPSLGWGDKNEVVAA